MTRSPSHRQRSGRALATPWALLLLHLAGLTASLALHQLLAAGASGRRVGEPVFDAATPTGPVADLSSAPLRWARGDGRGVGLALVDVGDADAADRAAEVLARHGVAASWFLSGRTIADHAGLVDVALREDGEIGITGYTGRDLAELPDWRVRPQPSATPAGGSGERCVGEESRYPRVPHH